MSTAVESPRSPYIRPARGKRRFNMEKWAWLYMRISGVILVFLIFGHLFVNLMLGDGIKAVDFAFVGGKWSSPFWQIWDLLMLWLALIHGSNGMRTLINDYVTRPATARALKFGLAGIAALLILLGTLVIFTFDPCPVGVDPSLIADFCTAN